MATRRKTTARTSSRKQRSGKMKTRRFFQGLRTVIYYVDDVTKAKSWYSDVLGFAPYFDEPFYVGFNVGGYELGIHPREEKHPASVGSAFAYWGVDDAERAFARLIKLGAEAYVPPEDVGGGIKIGAVKDPFGNLLGVIENPTFKITR